MMAERLENDYLQRLSDANLDVAEGEPDVRGWTVRTRDGRDLGEVEDLIVDTQAMKVRYLEVTPDNDAVVGATDRDTVFIPLTDADLNEHDEQVILRNTDLSAVRGLVPADFGSRFGHRTESAGIRRDKAQRVGRTAGFDRDESQRMARGAEIGRDESQRLTRAEEEVRVGTRAVQTGEVVVGKHVETEHVHEEVPVTKERVRVERRPVTDAQAGEIRGSEAEIRVPVTEEQVIVEKRPVVKEELVISKERVQETESVDAEVRKEEFDVRDSSKMRRDGGE